MQDARSAVFAAGRGTVQNRSNHNKAAYALANKMARICYATLRDRQPYDEPARLTRKMGRQSFVMPG